MSKQYKSLTLSRPRFRPPSPAATPPPGIRRPSARSIDRSFASSTTPNEEQRNEEKSRTISTEPRERLERLLTIDDGVGNPRRSQIQRLASRTPRRGPGVAILLGFRRRRRRSVHDGAVRARETASGVLFAFRRAVLRRSRHRARRGATVRRRHRQRHLDRREKMPIQRMLSPLVSLGRLRRRELRLVHARYVKSRRRKYRA